MSCRVTPPCHNIFVHLLPHAFHPILGDGYNVTQEEPSWSSGVNNREAQEILHCSKAKASIGAYHPL
jgi:hypothetical protein